MSCPLCQDENIAPFCEAHGREYLLCGRCDLVFVPPQYHLPPAEQKRRYDLHENSPEDPAYRAFLNRLAAPMLAKLPPGSRGLDFGSGPGPVLAQMFREAGHSCALYDPHYAPDGAALASQYDFLACSETMEHLAAPGEEFARFAVLVKPGGLIGIMTQLRDEARAPFAQWHYAREETHVAFFSRAAMQWLASRHGLALEFHPGGVVLFLKG